MHSLITAQFDSLLHAEDGLDALHALPSKYMPDIADGVTVSCDKFGAFKLDQRVNLWSAQSATLSLLQLIRLTLFLQPLLAIMEDDIATPLRDAIDDFGISPNFTQDIQSWLAANKTIVMLRVRDESVDFLIPQVNLGATAHLISPIDVVFDTNLQIAFAAALGAIKSHHSSSRKSAT